MQALHGAQVFDGEALLAQPTVVFDDDGTIVAAGEDVPIGVPVVELPGATILPGLVDSHQHLCFDGLGTLEEQVAGIDDVALLERCRAAGAQALAAGITTVRDLGDRDYVSLELRGEDGLPTILCAGPPMTRANGHCWYLGGETGTDEAALRSAVRARHERGCDLVKVMVTGGAGTPTFPLWTSQFSTGELQTIVDEAHGLGLPVAAHCHGIDGIRSALAARVDSIEHCTFFAEGGRSMPDPELVAELTRSGIAISASLGRLPSSDDVVPPVIADNLAVITRTFGEMLAGGAVLCVGTDAGIAPIKPHDVLPHALADLVAIGATPVDGLRAITSVAAGVVGLGDRKGRLRPGYDADVLAVHGDPLVDAGALTRPAGVWKGGVRIR